MVFNRDLSVVAIAAYARLLAPLPEFIIVEPLTATGVRGVRYALEVEGPHRVVMGDIDGCAVEITGRNINLNKLAGRARVYWLDARELLLATRSLLEKPPLVIDIDPFGSPAPYLDAALSVIGNYGLLAVTATDLAVLEGSKRRAARRRYGVDLVKAPESKEIGLRILLGYIARVAASHDKYIEPVLSYYADHYFRAYVIVRRGARKADKMLENSIGHAHYCRGDKRTYILEEPPACISYSRPERIGPLWISSMNNASFIREAIKELKERRYLATVERGLRLLGLLECESSLEDRILHVSIDQIASFARKSMPPIDKLVSLLRSEGHAVCRSHYSPIAIRTSAPYASLVKLLLASV